MQIIYWVINGFLVTIYLLIQNWPVLILAPGIVILAKDAPPAYRPWMIATIGMSVTLGLLMPLAGGILAVMVWAGIGAARLEHFNPDMLRWRVNTSLALYSLLGLAYALLLRLGPTLGSTLAVGTAGLTAQNGMDYFGTIANWALIVILPLGYFGLLAQAIFTMPPATKRPVEMLDEIRTRGRREDW